MNMDKFQPSNTCRGGLLEKNGTNNKAVAEFYRAAYKMLEKAVDALETEFLKLLVDKFGHDEGKTLIICFEYFIERDRKAK